MNRAIAPAHKTKSQLAAEWELPQNHISAPRLGELLA
jgi:hypothetical protein